MRKKLVSTVFAVTVLTGNMMGSVAYANTVSTPLAITNSAEEIMDSVWQQMIQEPVYQAVASDVVKVTPFTLHQSNEFAEYAKQFQITGIASYSNNGGKYSSSTLNKAFDGDLSTHWETGKPNSQSFTNEVTVVFEQIEELNRIVYGARNDASNKGHVTKVSIYGSKTESGNDFSLIASSNVTKTSGLSQIQFPVTECRRIKFVFDQAERDWASAREFWFFKEDAVLDEIDTIFTNGLMNELTQNYQSEAAREGLLNQFSTHPLKNSYKAVLDTMVSIGKGEHVSENEVITMPQKGNESAERNRCQLTYALYAHEATGVYLRPGEVLQVYVDADANGIMPEIVFGNSKFQTLKPGYNEIKLPEDITTPQPMYLANRAYHTQQAYQPRIRVVGGHEYPVYIHGKTDPKEFHEKLLAYAESVTLEGVQSGQGNPNMADLFSENIHIQSSAKGMAIGLTQQLNGKNAYADYTMEIYEDMYREFVEYSGFDYDLVEGREWNHRPLGKFMIVGSSGGPYGWAQHGFTGYNGGGGLKDSGFWVSLVQASVIENGGWALFHEVAHQYDSATLGTGESTNNLYSLLMQDKYLDKNRMTAENRWEKHFTAYHNTKVYPNDLLFLGAITYQLQGIYGDHIYGEAQKLARQNTNQWLSGMNNKQRIAVGISKVLGINVLPHYEYYGIEMNDRAQELVADLPIIDIKSYYANDKIYDKEACSFSNSKVKPSIAATGSKEITLKMSIEESEKALLVYEIYRDDEFLGVTYNDTFVDKTAVPGTEHSYTVKAYDRKFNVSLESNPVIKNASEPLINIADKLTTALYEEFDPMQHITATDVDGNDITSNIEVIENTVNTAKKGDYTVKYRVMDQDGNLSFATVSVHVAANVVYADAMTPKSYQGYYKVNKDHNNSTITLLGKYGEVAYAHGIGAHANTTVTYSLEGKDYDTFEAYIGLDDAVRTRTQASVIFAVYADEEKIFDSGIMKASEIQKLVSLNVKGVKELKLVTTDAGNGNSYDHSMWADVKFIQESGKPVLTVPSDDAVKVGETFADYADGYSAFDIEDGDLTSKVRVEGQVNTDKPGKYNITYTVTDSDGNEASATRTIAVVDMLDSIYVSDVNWASASCGWGSIKKDLSPSDKTIRLTNIEGAEVSFEKGLGAHAHSVIKYDLTSVDAEYFSSYVGVDRAMFNSVGSVTFEVYVDGSKVAETPLMTGKTPMQYLEAKVAGAKELMLVATTGGNGNGSDHSVWADAKFHYANEDRRTTKHLADAVQKAKEMDLKIYTINYVTALKTELEKAEAVLMNAGSLSQETIDEAVLCLYQVMDTAEISQAKIELGKMLIEAFDAKYSFYSESIMWDDYCYVRSTYQMNYEAETCFTELEFRIMTVMLEQWMEMLSYEQGIEV